MAIKCCNGCVPPKRTPTCHSTCSDYIIEKAFEEANRLAELEEKKTRRTISEQRGDSIAKRIKRHGRKRKDNIYY